MPEEGEKETEMRIAVVCETGTRSGFVMRGLNARFKVLKIPWHAYKIRLTMDDPETIDHGLRQADVIIAPDVSEKIRAELESVQRQAGGKPPNEVVAAWKSFLEKTRDKKVISMIGADSKVGLFHNLFRQIEEARNQKRGSY